jgi:hypothetical protein
LKKEENRRASSKKEKENTILRIHGAWTFSHSLLDPTRTFDRLDLGSKFGYARALPQRGITMQFRVRKAAHVLERIGLAMAGASSGLFVGLHVGSSFAALTSQGFLVVMMIGGAIGFYLGIDTPQLAFHGPSAEPSKGGYRGKVDTAEFLTAAGTFLATLAAFVSVGVIVLRENPRTFWTITIMLGWVVGVIMQIVAGAIARTRT